MTDHLAEDWDGRYWWTRSVDASVAFVEDGRRWRLVYSAMCSDLECCWPVIVRRVEGGWWWEHDGETAGPERGGPHEHWQDAARAAVTDGGARPRR